jgi:hypothetical protein
MSNKWLCFEIKGVFQFEWVIYLFSCIWFGHMSVNSYRRETKLISQIVCRMKMNEYVNIRNFSWLRLSLLIFKWTCGYVNFNVTIDLFFNLKRYHWPWVMLLHESHISLPWGLINNYMRKLKLLRQKSELNSSFIGLIIST